MNEVTYKWFALIIVEDRIGRIAFNFKIIGYKMYMDFLNVSLRFSRDVGAPNFTTVQDNGTRVSRRKFSF